MKKIILILLFLNFSSFKLTAQDQKYIDSLTTILKNTKIDSLKVELLNKLCYLISTKNGTLAFNYGQESIQLATKSDFQKGLCHAYNNMGILYDQRGQADSALFYYKQTLDLSKKIKNIYLESSALGNLGYIHWSQGEYTEALDYSLKSLSILDTGTNYNATGNVIEHVAMIYYDLKNYENSIKYHRKAILAYEKTKSNGSIGNVYCNLALNYFETNKDSMIYYLKKAEKIFIEYNDHWALGHVFNNIGGLYFEMKQYDPALTYLTKARQERKMVGDERGMCSTNTTLGMVWLMKKNTLLAKQYIDTAIVMSKKMDMQEDLAGAYRAYSLVYSKMGLLDSVTKYLDLETSIKDSLYSAENTSAIADMQTKYDTEKKDLEIIAHKAELSIKEKQGFIKNMIIVSVLTLMGFLFVLGYSFYRKKQIEQKAILDSELAKQKEIRSKAIIDAEEKERRRIAQDLHDGIGQILSAAKLNLSSLESSLKTDHSSQKEALKNTLSLIDDSVKEVRAVSHNMMPNTLIKLGLASAVKEFITKIGSLPNLKIDLEIVGLDLRLEESTETAIYRAIQEIVNNIVKHAKANKISIQLIRHETEISIVVEDNGIGFDTQKINEFEGIGLKNIFSRIEFINGKVHFDSQPGRGTTVLMDIPV